ncbi:hypothetical protein CCO03_07475 [Comamonas serinivorans]|uniref:Glycoside hydrolase family 42 N-terminal domain-containing protein n=1 Tax=Comamonas serinivorans TaxID=1082851 RepID=A0A1Y0EMI3_9BURK|nr:hypothetical protein [Comamonas serinivorans]ARU04539.1 hypothetical protein CCO03_07475 [Comamonas serinivorans]
MRRTGAPLTCHGLWAGLVLGLWACGQAWAAPADASRAAASPAASAAQVTQVAPASSPASPPASEASGAQPAGDIARFFLTPHLDRLDICDQAQGDARLRTMAQVRRVCDGLGDQLGGTAAATLSQALEALEPGGAQGAVQVGYTLTLPLLGLYRREGDDWVIDDARLNPLLALIEQVDRPVVVHLASSPVDATGPLPEALRQDARNLMQLADGSVPQRSDGVPALAYTLLTDPDIPVNRYRFRALHEVAARLQALPEAARARIVGYTLGGELHQLFPDFEQGAGRFDPVQVTDYSPASIAAFREWLQRKWGAVRRLNAATGLAFDGFEAIDAPRGKLQDGSARTLAEHYSAYAAGQLPIAGWVHDPQGRIDSLTLFLNGKPVGEVTQGYNRLDVYRARDEVLNPNVGYRYDLDVSVLAPGRYLAQVVAQVDGLSYELAQTRFTLAGRTDSLREREPRPARRLQEVKAGNAWQRWWRHLLRTLGFDRSLPTYARVPDVDSQLDLPARDLVVHYNPLAREWDLFRNHQVLAAMQALYDQAVAAGLPPGELYSHQVNDRINSAWNAQLLAVDDVWAARQAWQAGMTLYGGATHNALVLRQIRRQRLTGFAAPEFNPQQWKVRDAPLKALRAQREAGARFVSPVYLSLVPARLKAAGQGPALGPVGPGVNRLALDPANPQDGSDLFYQAIQTLAAE